MLKKHKNKLDKLWAERIHERPSRCECCGKTNCRLEAHHIFTRSRLSTRWDLDNGLLLCSNCHKFSSICSAHTAPYAFFKWLEKEKGKRWLDKLEKKSNQILSESVEEIKEKLFGLKNN